MSFSERENERQTDRQTDRKKERLYAGDNYAGVSEFIAKHLKFYLHPDF